MSILSIRKYAAGYVTIRVEGIYLEKFLNISVAVGVNFWDIKRINMTTMELNLSIGDYRRIKEIIRTTGCRISIVSKHGMPFSFLKIKHRKMLGIGMVVFIFLIFMLSSFIWSVKVTGTENVSEKEIKEKLSELGVKPGVMKINIPVTEIENKMLINMNSISWIKLKITGTRAEVEVRERVVPPKIVPQNIPCNILAKRDGIIYKIISAKGDEKVKEGDPVKKGDLLVTGIIERPDFEKRYVHSSAVVLARTWYESKSVIPLQSIKKVRSGKKLNKVYIKLGSKTLLIKNPVISFKSYDKIDKSAKLIDTEKLQLPIEIKIEEYWENVNKREILSIEEAKARGIEAVEKDVIDNMPSDAKIISKKINSVVQDNAVIVSAMYETLEDIGIQQEIN